jgi:uncharacterized cupredoxin-like copper-binding protein
MVKRMKKLGLIFSIFFVFLMFASASTTQASSSGADSVDACTNPTQTVELVADPSNDGSLKYDKTELRLDKNACVKIKFINKSLTTDHDLTVDASDDFDGVYLWLLNNTDGVDGGDYKEVNVQTPDADITLEFYCQVTGHSATMFGDFIIGEGGSLPGFSLGLALISLLGLAAIPIIRRR